MRVLLLLGSLLMAWVGLEDRAGRGHRRAAIPSASELMEYGGSVHWGLPIPK